MGQTRTTISLRSSIEKGFSASLKERKRHPRFATFATRLASAHLPSVDAALASLSPFPLHPSWTLLGILVFRKRNELSHEKKLKLEWWDSGRGSNVYPRRKRNSTRVLGSFQIIILQKKSKNKFLRKNSVLFPDERRERRGFVHTGDEHLYSLEIHLTPLHEVRLFTPRSGPSNRDRDWVDVQKHNSEGSLVKQLLSKSNVKNSSRQMPFFVSSGFSFPERQGWDQRCFS